MYTRLIQFISHYAAISAPATGIGLFRLLYGLVMLQEIVFLIYFNHLIFDPIPYLDVEFPLIPLFLCLWAVCAGCLCIGYRSQQMALVCYAFWIVFVQFTPMQRDFDGGFDLFMIGAGLFLLFMPIDKAFAIDQLRAKFQNPFKHYNQYTPERVSILAYYLPVSVCLGFLYFDSAIHKLFAEHWLNGLGSWLPGTQPYYVSALDMSPLLNCELLQKTIGYTILIFQFSFIFLLQNRYLRPIYLLLGIALHLGIMFTLNIYPFGAGMLIFYVLLVPFSWWRCLDLWVKSTTAALSIFYDEKCPLCNRTALTLKHFDIFNRLDFKGVQSYAREHPELDGFSDEELLIDLYTVDRQGVVSYGVNAYSQILIAMRYLAPLGVFIRLPGIYQLACRQYRLIADNRQRIVCDEHCVLPSKLPLSCYDGLMQAYQQKPKRIIQKVAKFLMILFALQLNSSIHYGIVYRLKIDLEHNPLLHAASEVSNSVLLLTQAFTGITPHALYLHDHFAGYDRIIALSYIDTKGEEHWLPFVNKEGRLLAPNWGRVHSMWANIAVTPTINDDRLTKFIMKVTAYYGQQLAINLNQAEFIIKLKKIQSPTTWVYDQRKINLSGDWQNIGKAHWTNQHFSIQLPNNINDL